MVSNGGDRPRERAKRTHLLSNRAHRTKVSNRGDGPRETVKRTHRLSNRAHRAKVSNKQQSGQAARDGEKNSRTIESSPSGEG
jgi:hypothetical protein